MSFTSFGDGLTDLVQAWAKDEEFRWRLVETAWRRTAGDRVGQRTKAESLDDDGVLTVRVADPSWLPTLRDLSAELLRGIGQRPGGQFVRRIAWVADGPEPPRAGRRSR